MSHMTITSIAARCGTSTSSGFTSGPALDHLVGVRLIRIDIHAATSRRVRAGRALRDERIRSERVGAAANGFAIAAGAGGAAYAAARARPRTDSARRGEHRRDRRLPATRCEGGGGGGRATAAAAASRRLRALERISVEPIWIWSPGQILHLFTRCTVDERSRLVAQVDERDVGGDATSMTACMPTRARRRREGDSAGPCRP